MWKFGVFHTMLKFGHFLKTFRWQNIFCPRRGSRRADEAGNRRFGFRYALHAYSRSPAIPAGFNFGKSEVSSCPRRGLDVSFRHNPVRIFFRPLRTILSLLSGNSRWAAAPLMAASTLRWSAQEVKRPQDGRLRALRSGYLREVCFGIRFQFPRIHGV